ALPPGPRPSAPDGFPPAAAAAGGADALGSARLEGLGICGPGGGRGCLTRVLRDLHVLHCGDGGAMPRALMGQAVRGGLRCGGARWTHVVDLRATGSPPLPPELARLRVLDGSVAPGARGELRTAEDFLRMLPAVFDFLRLAALRRGAVLLVDGPAAPHLDGAGAAPGGFAIAAVLALMAESSHLGVYPALCSLSSQVIVQAICPVASSALAAWCESERRGVWSRSAALWHAPCLCGACSWHLPPQWLRDAARPSGAVSCEGRPSEGACLALCSCAARSHDGGARPPTCLGPAGRRPRGGALPACRPARPDDARWLWLPQGFSVNEFSAGRTLGSLTNGLKFHAEPVPRERGSGAQHYRCRGCRALTHAVVDVVPGQHQRVAVICSSEVLRQGEVGVLAPPEARPPLSSCLADLVLPPGN
ncbi:unnamed protein product, partial [Prorocentrum cordatum]